MSQQNIRVYGDAALDMKKEHTQSNMMLVGMVAGVFLGGYVGTKFAKSFGATTAMGKMYSAATVGSAGAIAGLLGVGFFENRKKA